MTTALGAGASLVIRVGALMLAALGILLLISAAAMADTIAVTPTGPAPVPDVPTITLWRDGAIMAALVIGIAVIVWRASMLDTWLRSRVELHGLAAALMEDELVKRGVLNRQHAAPPALEDDDPFAAEANKAAPPPPPPAPTPRRVTPSTKTVAQTFSPRRVRGEKMQ